MEKHILPQPKPVRQAICADFPAGGKARLDFQGVIELYQSVEQTINCPNIILSTRKSRIQRGDRIVLIVSKSAALRLFSWFVGAGKQGKQA
jgi:hypothetical protein